MGLPDWRHILTCQWTCEITATLSAFSPEIAYICWRRRLSPAAGTRPACPRRIIRRAGRGQSCCGAFRESRSVPGNRQKIAASRLPTLSLVRELTVQFTSHSTFASPLSHLHVANSSQVGQIAGCGRGKCSAVEDYARRGARPPPWRVRPANSSLRPPNSSFQRKLESRGALHPDSRAV